VLERLFGFPAPLRLWEAEILPTRLRPYRASWLDELLRGSELQWFGCGRRRIAFCFSSDLELYLESEEGEEAEQLRQLLPSARGKFSFWDLVDHAGASPTETTQRIWELVWKGRLAADSFSVLRTAAAGGFRENPQAASGGPRRTRAAGSKPGRRSFDGWRTAHPLSASWFAVAGADASDPLEEQELSRARVRQLLERYGILFRELLSRELGPLQWSRLFRTLRIMELSGEILSGYFFEGISGVQFASHRGFRLLREGLPDSAVFWISAADPASVSGLGLPIDGLPPRLATSHLVYHGSRLVLVSKKGGKDLELRIVADHPSLQRYLGLFADHLTREAAPRTSIRVERINELPARASPYKQAFLDYGFVEEYKGLVLRAGY
jgi:ATP-dependent Lhr-like helicase